MHLGGDQDSEHPSPNPDATGATGATTATTGSALAQVEKAREALEQMRVENGGAGKS